MISLPLLLSKLKLHSCFVYFFKNNPKVQNNHSYCLKGFIDALKLGKCSRLVHHAIHHQVLWSSESACVQYVCNSGEVVGQYNVTLDNTKPP